MYFPFGITLSKTHTDSYIITFGGLSCVSLQQPDSIYSSKFQFLAAYMDFITGWQCSPQLLKDTHIPSLQALPFVLTVFECTLQLSQWLDTGRNWLHFQQQWIARYSMPCCPNWWTDRLQIHSCRPDLPNPNFRSSKLLFNHWLGWKVLIYD